MTGVNSDAAAELLGLLSDQRVAYRKLKGLTDRQRVLVSEDDPQALLGVLAERQRVVDELTSLNQRLAPYRRDWTRFYHGLEAGAKRQVKEMLEESNELLSCVMQSDRQDSETLGARRHSTAATLSQSRVTGRANAAYARTAASPWSAPQLTEAQA